MRVNYGCILNLEKVGFYYLGYLPRYCFITLAPGGLCYKNSMIINDASRAISGWCHNLEHHLQPSIMLLDSSIMFLGNIHGTSIAHDDHHFMIVMFIVHVTGDRQHRPWTSFFLILGYDIGSALLYFVIDFRGCQKGITIHNATEAYL